MIILGINLFSPYLGINCCLHNLSISVPGDLSSRFGSWGSAGEVVWCVGLKTYNRAALHHRVWGRNYKAEQTYHSKQNKKKHYSCRPKHSHSLTDIELAVALCSASICCNSKRGKQFLVMTMCLLTRWSFKLEKSTNSCHVKKETKNTNKLNLIYFLSWDYHYCSICSYCCSDVSTELLICSFICMVSHAPLASQACHPWWRRLSPQPIREGVNMEFVLAFLAPSTKPISLCVSELSEVLPLPRHGH